jgi:hypothetical protein
MADQVTVTIKRDPQKGCVPDPNPFHAKPGDDVKFEFEPPNEGTIDFGSKSPFDEATFTVGTGGTAKKSKGGVSGTFLYKVLYKGGGNGNGSGIFP